MKNLRYKQGTPIEKLPTSARPLYRTKAQYESRLSGLQNSLSQLQEYLYIERQRSVLIVFQGMDTSGKDGAIKHALSGLNPQACSVSYFRRPSSEELNHDFLWRVNKRLPERGQVGIFNRSHYEEVLVAKVHPEILSSQNLPDSDLGSKQFWKRRYEDIVSYERYLARQGTHIIKIFIHISKREQLKRLLSRFDDPVKQWKVSKDDIVSREHWDAFQKAYGECLDQTSTQDTPWYVVPGDDKKNARLMIAGVVQFELNTMDLKQPRLDSHQEKELVQLREILNETK